MLQLFLRTCRNDTAAVQLRPSYEYKQKDFTRVSVRLHVFIAMFFYHRINKVYILKNKSLCNSMCSFNFLNFFFNTLFLNIFFALLHETSSSYIRTRDYKYVRKPDIFFLSSRIHFVLGTIPARTRVRSVITLRLCGSCAASECAKNNHESEKKIRLRQFHSLTIPLCSEHMLARFFDFYVNSLGLNHYGD